MVRSFGMDEQPGLVARAAIRLTAWTEKWVPDAFIFALLATIIVFAAALIWTPSTFTQVVDAWGNGFWDLIPFTLQMSLIIITGHVLATSRAGGRGDSRDCRLAAHAARRRRAGDVLRAGDLVVQLGLQPDLQRRAGEGSRAPRARRRLSRARRGELPRHRQHLGAGAQRIGGAADGHARRAAAADPRHRRQRRHGARRHHPVPRHDLSLAEPRVGDRRDGRRDAGDVAGHAAGRPRRRRRAISASTLGEAEFAPSPRPQAAEPRAVARTLADPQR